MKPRRNDPCPCGSGRRYKNCCARRNKAMSGRVQSMLAFAAVGLIGAIVLATTYRNSVLRRETAIPARPFPVSADQSIPAAATSPAPVPQPPGDAPPGKVWSPEHGHWHDLVMVPQPDGPVPPGKVWVPEHGHWHDIVTGAAYPAVPDSAQGVQAGAAVTQ